jgi:hypothetical protein
LRAFHSMLVVEFMWTSFEVLMSHFFNHIYVKNSLKFRERPNVGLNG